MDGALTVSVCSATFGASVTVIGDFIDANGTQQYQQPLACGGAFIDCSDPLLQDPDSELM